MRRIGQGAIRLPDGRILVFGGLDLTSPGNPATKTSEIFDPSANSWSAGPDFALRAAAAVTVTSGDIVVFIGPRVTQGPVEMVALGRTPADGKGLGPLGDTTFAGGYALPGDLIFAATRGQDTASFFVYDYATRKTIASGPLPPAVLGIGSSVAEFDDGNLLLLANDRSGKVYLFDWRARLLSEAPSIRDPLEAPTALQVGKGKVLALGWARDSTSSSLLPRAESFDGRMWSDVSAPSGIQPGATVTVLQDGRILALGGAKNRQNLDACQMSK
jgi:hypothetical protein